MSPPAMRRRSRARAVGGLSACWLFTGFAAIILVLFAWFIYGPDDDDGQWLLGVRALLSRPMTSSCARFRSYVSLADLRLTKTASPPFCPPPPPTRAHSFPSPLPAPLKVDCGLRAAVWTSTVRGRQMTGPQLGAVYEDAWDLAYREGWFKSTLVQYKEK